MVDVIKHNICPVRVDDLVLDLENPRFIGIKFKDEEEMIAYLYANADLSELLLSIINSGYMDFEPIVVRDRDKAVLEGNRRVAALRLIKDDALRAKLNIKLPAAASPSAKPDEIQAVIVDSASEARRYIGFKHINGAQKWDAMSKAKYAADWHSEGASLNEISSALGDTFNTVSRLVNGYKVYEQAVELGFDIEKRSAKRFAFSHLYTALSRASIKEWLELAKGVADSPVPTEHASRLLELMSWLYGQGDAEPAVVRTQNPDLNRLADVIGNSRTRQMLSAHRNLDVAFEELEPRSARLETALIQAVRHTEQASAIAASFDGQETTYELGRRLFQAAQKLFKGFRDTKEKLEGLGDDFS